MRRTLLLKTMLLLCTLVAGVGNVWGTSTTYTYTWTAGNSPSGSVTLGAASWNFSYTWKSSSAFNYDGTKGQQIGTAKNPVRTATISTSSFSSKKITELHVWASTAASATATISATVGGTSYFSSSLTSSNTEYKKTDGISTGDIVITLSQPSTDKGLYIKKIQIVYEEADNTDYTITIDSENISNGSVTASASSAKSGTQITLTPTPDSGYKLSAWDVRDASDNEVTVTNNKFTMPSSNVTVGATFSPLYGVTVNSVSHGSMSASPTSAIEGETVTLTATPDTNYELTGITVTNSSTSATVSTSGTGNTRTFTMPAAAVSVTPVFSLQKGIEINPFTVAEALAYIAGGGSTTDIKYVKGITSVRLNFTKAKVGGHLPDFD